MLDPRDWFLQFITGMAAALGDAYGSLMIGIAKVLLYFGLPDAGRLRQDWFLTRLGGTYGLAENLLRLIAIIVGLVVLLNPLGRHGKRIGQTVMTGIYLGVFAAGFFPLYSLLAGLSHGLGNVVLNLASGTVGTSSDDLGTLLQKTVLPVNPFGALLTILVSGFFGLGLLVEVIVLQLMTFAIVLFYPIVLALRPLGKNMNTAFNAMNAGIVVGLFSPSLMVFFLLLPVIARDHIPLGDTSLVRSPLGGLGHFLAAIIPIVIAHYAFKTSSEVFGEVDSFASGVMDIGDMPTVSTQQMQADVTGVRGEGLTAFTTSLLPGMLGADLANSDDLWGDVRKIGVEAAGAAGAATGHPWVAGVANAIDTTTTKEKRKHEAETITDPV